MKKLSELEFFIEGTDGTSSSLPEEYNKYIKKILREWIIKIIRDEIITEEKLMEIFEIKEEDLSKEEVK